jgi:hypothetical protein
LSFQKKIPLPIPIDIAETIQAYSCSLYKTRPPNTIIIIPRVLLFIDKFITYIKVISNSISHGKGGYLLLNK